MRRRWVLGAGAVVAVAAPPAPASQAEPVAKPRFVKNMASGETGWFSSPSLADLDGDRRLEIVVSTFDHGIDVYRVPRSRPNRLPWPTGRGSVLRRG